MADLFPAGLRVLNQFEQDGNGLLGGGTHRRPRRHDGLSLLALLTSSCPLRVEINESRSHAFPAESALTGQLQQRVVDAHGEQRGKFFMGHPLWAGLHQVRQGPEGKGLIRWAVDVDPLNLL